MASIVVISEAPMLSTGVMQERVATPSTCTVQAPHSAMPHPNFVPVMPSTSRNTHKSGVSPSTSTVRSTPLILIAVAMATSRLSRGSGMERDSLPWQSAGNAQLGCRRSGRKAARSGRSLPGRFQRLAPPHQVVEHRLPALHQIAVIIQRATALDDPKIWLHRDVHFLPDRRHLQLDDHAAQGLDRARRADAAVADKGDGLALPFEECTVEGVLENRRGTVI